MPELLEEADVRLDAGGADHHVGGQRVAAGQPHLERRARMDRLDARRRVDRHALSFHPAPDHRAGALAHHPRHHAVAGLDDRELHAARGERFHDDAADEAGADLQHARARLRQRHDLARVGERPARVHALHVDARDRRPDRRRAGREQQGVERDGGAVVEQHLASGRVDRLRPSGHEFDALPGEVVLALAQVRPRLVDPAHQQVRNRHPRIRRLGLVADQHDGVVRRLLADRLRRDDAGGAVAEDDVSQVGLHGEFGRSARNRPCAALAAPPAGSLTARGGSASPSSAVPCRPSRAARSTRAASCRDR